MGTRPTDSRSGIDQRVLAVLLVLIAAAVFSITWVGIRESRSDSLELLVLQGTAFTEALAQAAENAMSSEAFVDQLVYRRYSDIVRGLQELPPDQFTDDNLAEQAAAYGVLGIYIFDSTGELQHGGALRPEFASPPPFVAAEVNQLLVNLEDRYTLLLDEDEHPGEARHYYLEIGNDLAHVFVLTMDALYYVEGLTSTQIGYLAQNMAREAGVEYIIYQSTEGIIFSSRRVPSLLAIESDPFLTNALSGDTIDHRLYTLQEREVLELVRPFSSADYPFGLLRVGLSLEGYHRLSGRFDRLMITLAVVMFVLLLLAMLYLGSRRKRDQISREYSRMKTITDRIFEEMGTGVAATDAEGVITLANAAFSGIVGTGSLPGKRWDDAIPWPGLGFEDIAAESQESFEREVFTGAGDAERALLVAVSGLEAESGAKSGFVAVVSDITRLRGLERKAARKERLSEMGNLAAGVAHEIRNPLNAISIAAQRLGSEFKPQEGEVEFQTITGQINEETRRLNQIISRFLALTREGKSRSQTVRLDLLIQEIGTFLQSEAGLLRIELGVEVSEELPVTADPDELKQVFTNLFNNSKESLAGAPGEIAIAARRGSESVEVLFADTGPGIPEDVRETLFTPYFTTKDSGTGLGLAIVHQIVSGLGGDIKVVDSDVGAAFLITLPLADE